MYVAMSNYVNKYQVNLIKNIIYNRLWQCYNKNSIKRLWRSAFYHSIQIISEKENKL